MEKLKGMLLDQDQDLPKYVILQRAIRENIDRGVYPAGERIPSENALAKQTGMARMTVRQAIGNLVNLGVLERRHGAGTFVVDWPKGRDIGLVFLRLYGLTPRAFAWQETDAVRNVAAEEGRRLRPILMSPPFPVHFGREVRAMGIGAVGLMNATENHRNWVAVLRRQLPCVLIGRDLEGSGLSCAKPDMAHAARTVVDYFIGRGRSRIGVMACSAKDSEQAEFLPAIEAELRRRGLPVEPTRWFRTSRSASPGDADPWIIQMLSEEDRPDALVSASGNWLSSIRIGLTARGEDAGRAMDLLEVTEAMPGDAPRSDIPWARLSLEYGEVIRNVLRLIEEVSQQDGGAPEARVLTSETRLIPPDS